MTQQRIAEAVTLTGPARLAVLETAPPAVLLCELQRVHALLTGSAYYDYDAQKWVEAVTEDKPEDLANLFRYGIR